MTYLERYAFWCNAGLPTDAQQELLAIKENDEELTGRFGSDLQFGTAGMRGIMGVGTNRLNRYTVRRAAQGMAAWLCGSDLPSSFSDNDDPHVPFEGEGFCRNQEAARSSPHYTGRIHGLRLQGLVLYSLAGRFVRYEYGIAVVPERYQ